MEKKYIYRIFGRLVSVEIKRLAMDLYATLYHLYSRDAERYHENNYDPTTLIKRLPEHLMDRSIFIASFYETSWDAAYFIYFNRVPAHERKNGSFEGESKILKK